MPNHTSQAPNLSRQLRHLYAEHPPSTPHRHQDPISEAQARPSKSLWPSQEIEHNHTKLLVCRSPFPRQESSVIIEYWEKLAGTPNSDRSSQPRARGRPDPSQQKPHEPWASKPQWTFKRPARHLKEGIACFRVTGLTSRAKGASQSTQTVAWTKS